GCSVPEASVDPVCDDVDGVLVEGGLDCCVLAERAGGRGLEQVVEPGQFNGGRVVVLAQGFGNGGQILLGRHLHVQFAVEGEHGHHYFRERTGRIVRQERAHPRCRERLDDQWLLLGRGAEYLDGFVGQQRFET